MSSYTKEAAGWLRYRQAELGQEYTLTALESQNAGDEVLILDEPGERGMETAPTGSGDGTRSDYYILEARDRTQPYGAPETGVVIYHVTRDGSSGQRYRGAGLLPEWRADGVCQRDRPPAQHPARRGRGITGGDELYPAQWRGDPLAGRVVLALPGDGADRALLRER